MRLLPLTRHLTQPPDTPSATPTARRATRSTGPGPRGYRSADAQAAERAPLPRPQPYRPPRPSHTLALQPGNMGKAAATGMSAIRPRRNRVVACANAETVRWVAHPWRNLQRNGQAQPLPQPRAPGRPRRPGHAARTAPRARTIWRSSVRAAGTEGAVSQYGRPPQPYGQAQQEAAQRGGVAGTGCGERVVGGVPGDLRLHQVVGEVCRVHTGIRSLVRIWCQIGHSPDEVVVRVIVLCRRKLISAIEGLAPSRQTT